MDNIEKLRKSLPENFECALITSDINRRYFTGMKSSAGTVLIFPDEAYLIIDFRYIEKARQTVKNCTVIEQNRLFHQIHDLLKKKDVKKVLVENKSMTLEGYSRLCNSVRHIEFVNSGELSNAIYKCRTVKEEWEIEKIIKAQRIAEKAFDETLKVIKPGNTEKDVALSLDYNMRKFGAEDLSFTTIAITGKKTSMPHGVPGEDIIQEHDFFLMDFGATYDGYHSDMTRTVSVGEPTEKMKEVYDIVLRAQTESIKAVKAGISGKELDSIGRNIIEEAGYGKNFGHSLGHGVGLEIHEYPLASPGYDIKLEEKNIVTVEPGIYLPGEFGVRIEDFVVVKQDGCFDMTNAKKNLIIL